MLNNQKSDRVKQENLKDKKISYLYLQQAKGFEE